MRYTSIDFVRVSRGVVSSDHRILERGPIGKTDGTTALETYQRTLDFIRPSVSGCMEDLCGSLSYVPTVQGDSGIRYSQQRQIADGFISCVSRS